MQTPHKLRVSWALAINMHKLNLPTNELGDYYLNRSVKTLSNGINLNHTKDVERACELSILLFSSGHEDDSGSLLNSFAYDIEYKENSGAWLGKQVGLSLIAYQLMMDGEIDKAKDIVSQVFTSNPNLDIGDTDWVMGRLEDDVYFYSPRSEWPEDLRKDRQNAILGLSSNISAMIFNFVTCKLVRKDTSEMVEKAGEIIMQDFAELRKIFGYE